MQTCSVDFDTLHTRWKRMSHLDCIGIQVGKLRGGNIKCSIKYFKWPQQQHKHLGSVLPQVKYLQNVINCIYWLHSAHLNATKHVTHSLILPFKIFCRRTQRQSTTTVSSWEIMPFCICHMLTLYPYHYLMHRSGINTISLGHQESRL